MHRIVFYRKDAINILNNTSINCFQVGSLWGEGYACDDDLDILKTKGWWFEKI